METIVTVDSGCRVALEGAAPGDRFRVRVEGERRIFEKLDSSPDSIPLIRTVRRNGRLMLPVKLERNTIRNAVRQDREENQ